MCKRMIIAIVRYQSLTEFCILRDGEQPHGHKQAGTTGLKVRMLDCGRLVVMRVAAGSPADLSGKVHAGDVLVSIDEKEARANRLLSIQHTTSQFVAFALVIDSVYHVFVLESVRVCHVLGAPYERA